MDSEKNNNESWADLIDDKILVVVAMAVIAIVSLFTLTDKNAVSVITPIVTGLSGIAIGRGMKKN